MFSEALDWYVSIYLWLLFTGIGIPPVPEEAGILYAASVTALNAEVRGGWLAGRQPAASSRPTWCCTAWAGCGGRRCWSFAG